MKSRLAILFGGKSAEHEISLLSATNIYNAIDTEKFEKTLLGVDRKGSWRYNTTYTDREIDLTKNDYFATAAHVYLKEKDGKLLIINEENNEVVNTIDVVFPIIHGTYGEDGTLQGILKTLNIPYVGADVVGSSVGMDKDMAKRIWRDSNIAIADFFTLYKHNPSEVSYDTIISKFGLPIFVKPANAGSSVGVTKVTNEKEYAAALATAFRFDNKILVEQAIVGKEVECAILGNMEDVQASIIGEIVPTIDFYSYEAKYLNANGAKTKIPADILPDISDLIRKEAIKAFRAIGCEGLSRVDFFLQEDNTFVLNEINTLPGFTAISMYPKLWEATGIGYADLITKLASLAIARHKRDNALETAM